MQVCPVGFFCFNRDTLLITIVAIAMVISFFINKNNSMFDLIKSQLELQKQTLANKLNVIEDSSLPAIDTIEVKNLERISNPLLPPERSYNSSLYLNAKPATLINIPTRGPSSGIQQIGFIVENYTNTIQESRQPITEITPNNTTEPIANAIDKVATKIDTAVEKYISYNTETNKKMLPLFGEQTYPGSNMYRYYTMNGNIKLPISHKGFNCQDDRGCPEIYNDNELSVSGLGNQFKATLYQYDSPRYLPHIL